MTDFFEIDFVDALLDRLQPLAGWGDLLDVLLVALVIYNLLLLIRGTRAVQVVVGLVTLLAVYAASGWFRLSALETTLEKFFEVLPLAILVLFQHEIRRALANFGSTPFWTLGKPAQEVTDLYHEVAVAASTLSDRRVGALIVFERQEGLRNYIETGFEVDAKVSPSLLVSLFHPETPTHDGAVIVQGDRLAAATCFLPLTRSSDLSKELGTRHRAALGISEETDALALVVSEETGTISVAVGGEMHRRLSTSSLSTLLIKYLVTEKTRPEGVG